MTNNWKPDQLNTTIRSAKASLEMEGFTVTPEMDKLVRQKLLGDLTEEQFHEEVLRIVLSGENTGEDGW